MVAIRLRKKAACRQVAGSEQSPPREQSRISATVDRLNIKDPSILPAHVSFNPISPERSPHPLGGPYTSSGRVTGAFSTRQSCKRTVREVVRADNRAWSTHSSVSGKNSNASTDPKQHGKVASFASFELHITLSRIIMALAHTTCYQHFRSKTSMANAEKQIGPGAPCVGPLRSSLCRGPTALPGPCVGVRRSSLDALCVGPRISVSGAVGAQRSLTGPGPGAFCQGLSRGLPGFDRERWALQKELCVGPGLCVRAGALCRAPVLSGRSLCRGPALCVGPRRSL